MNDRQRTMLVVALGLAIAVIVYTWDATVAANGDGGWFAYAPNTGVVFSPEMGGRHLGRSSEIVRSGLMWLAGVSVWAAASYRILRSRDDSS